MMAAIVASISGAAVVLAATLPVLIRGKKVADTVGEANGDGTLAEMMHKQLTMFQEFVSGQAEQDIRIARIESMMHELSKESGSLQTCMNKMSGRMGHLERKLQNKK